MISRILLTVISLAILSFLLLVLIGLWSRYEAEAERSGFSGAYERYLASQAGFPNDPKAYRAAVEADLTPPAAIQPPTPYEE